MTRDLTERKAAELRVVAAYEESAKLKAAFLANTSHEIRTPLHGMLGALTLLMDVSSGGDFYLPFRLLTGLTKSHSLNRMYRESTNRSIGRLHLLTNNENSEASLRNLAPFCYR